MHGASARLAHDLPLFPHVAARTARHQTVRSGRHSAMDRRHLCEHERKESIMNLNLMRRSRNTPAFPSLIEEFFNEPFVMVAP
jgi:hypothetical protein